MHYIVKISFMLLIALGAAIAAMFYYANVMPFREDVFDKLTWHQVGDSKGEKDTSCVRGKMVNDVEKNYLHINLTSKEEVIALLGIPKILNKQNNCFSYRLGMCSGFKLDYDSLIICFNLENKVKQFYTMQY